MPTVRSSTHVSPAITAPESVIGAIAFCAIKPPGTAAVATARAATARSERNGTPARSTMMSVVPSDAALSVAGPRIEMSLAMAAAIRGYRLLLIMPEHMSEERRQVMRAFGAELIDVPRAGGMEAARDLALRLQSQGRGHVLDQFANPDNPLAHYRGTGPEIWRQSGQRITHFVASMGTTGTIMGVSRFLKERDSSIRVIGLQPAEGACIPGIRRWSQAYRPQIYEPERVDELIDVSQQEAETTMRELAAREGILCGVSSGGAVAGALRVAARTRGAVIATIVCDRGDRYLSTGVFDAH